MNLPKHIQEAIHEYINHMEGWTTPERCCEMAGRILESKEQVCVDIGVYAGRSTIAMGFAARQLGTCVVYGIDPWRPDVADENDDTEAGKQWWKEKSQLEEMHRQAMKAVWDHHLEQWIVIIRAKSEHAHKLFPEIGVLNVDGAHSELSSCLDIDLYLPKVKKGGLVFFDDSDWGSTRKALHKIEERCELISDTGRARTYRKL